MIAVIYKKGYINDPVTRVEIPVEDIDRIINSDAMEAEGEMTVYLNNGTEITTYDEIKFLCQP